MIANLEKVIKEHRIIGIDGRAGAGKTTLSAMIVKNNPDIVVFHMDDYFLRKEQVNEKRLALAGENIDHERFYEEIMLPLYKGEKTICHRHYDCHAQTLSPLIQTKIKGQVIIEGSYAFHPSLSPYYDLKIFVDIDKERQKERIINREGAKKAEIFFEKWIPLEEEYFKKYDIADKSDIIIDMDNIVGMENEYGKRGTDK